MKTPSTLRALLLGASFVAAPYAGAATLYWDSVTGGAINDGTAGAWLTAGLWNDAGVSGATWTSGDSAIFGNFGAGAAVTLGVGGTTANSLTFNYFTGTYTIGTVSNILTINDGITMNAGGGAVTLISPIRLGANQTWTNNTGNVMTVSDGTNSVIDTNGFTLTFKGGGPSQGKFNVKIGNGITGSGGIVVDNAYLDLRQGGNQSVNNYTGTTTLQNGAGILHQASNIGTGNIILNGGYLDGYFNSAFTRNFGTGNNQIQITGGVSGFGTNGSATINFGGVTEVTWGTASFNPSAFLLGSVTSSAGTTTFAEGIDLNGADRTITGQSTLNSGAFSGVIRNTNATAAGIIKTGVGTLIFSAANTYNGATTIKAGTLTLSTSGTLASTSALNLSGGGTLQLTNTAQVDRFNDGAAITVSSGGGITYANTAGANLNYTETLGSVSLNGGLLNVNLATNQNNATNNSQTLTLGGLSQSGTGSVAFSAAGTGPQGTGGDNMIFVTGSGTTTAGEIIGSWATVGTTAALQTDYAVYNSNFVTSAGIAASAQSGWSTDNTTGTGTLNNTSSALFSATLDATRNINSLRSTNSAASAAASNANITLTGHALAVGDVVTFSATTMPTGLTAGTPYYVVSAVAGTSIQVSATSGGVAITPTGASTAMFANSGILLSSGNNLGTTGILNGSATTLNILATGTGAVTLPTTSAGNLYVTTGSGGITIGAPITDNTGALTLVKNGSAGNLILNGVNTFTGNIAINAGTLQIGTNGSANGAKLGGAGGNYAGNIFIGSGATLYVSTNASQTLSGVISGDGGLTKSYTGTLTLTGDNTYTGKTYIFITNTPGGGQSAGTLSVASFNSVVGGTASSSLGAPITVANGTIDFGGGGVQNSATITYTGGGETTDRIINFQFNGTGNRTINASGSGLLKFTSAPTSNGTTTGSITLGGSGSGEFSLGLPFAYAGVITKNGASTWTLGGAVGTSGGVTLDGATAGSRLNINHSQALGTGTFTISGGNNATIGNTSGANITLTANNAQAWNSNFAVVADNSLNMGTGNVSMGGNRAIAVSGAGTYTVGGVVSGTGFGITLGGSGTMALTNVASTYTGQTIIGNNTAATLKLQVTKLSDLSATSSLGAPTTTANGLIQIGATSNTSTLELIGGSSASSTNRQIQIGSSTTGSGGATILNNNTNSAHTLTFSNAAFNVAATGTTTFNRTLTLGGTNTGDNTISGAIIPNGSTSGVTNLTKTGTGKWVLGGINTYTGATNVSGGILAVNGSLANTTGVTVGNTATLQGSGTINSSVSIQSGGTLAAGNSIESLATGELTLAAAAIFAYEMDNSVAAGVSGDLTAVTGNLTLDLGNASILNLAELGAGAWTAGESLTLISYSGTWNGGLFTYNSTTLADGATINFSGIDWTFDYNDSTAGDNYTGDLTGASFVTMTAIPEPKAALLGAIGLLLLLRRRR